MVTKTVMKIKDRSTETQMVIKIKEILTATLTATPTKVFKMETKMEMQTTARIMET